MLYHVPDLDRALTEVRRVLTPGGAFFAVTNGREHLRTLLSDAGAEPFAFSFSVENGEDLLRRHFDDVTTVRFSGRAEADHATAQAYLRTFLHDAVLPPYDGVRTYRGAGALFIAR